jgi:DNA-binding SARP family transcriptional activator
VSAYQGLVLALVAADRFDEARAAMQVLLKLDPTLSVTKIGRMSPYREHVREQRMEAYRKAGMPE